MSATDNIHISPDRLEEAVRGRLSPADMEEVRSHCATCDRCRNAYDEELRIAAGTKAWARHAMKQRLASRISHLPRHGIPWPRVLATAALVVVVVGVGILYRWGQTGTETLPLFTDDVREKAKDLAPENRQTPTTSTEQKGLSGDIAEEPRTGTAREKKEAATSPRADRPSLNTTSPLAEEPATAPLAAMKHADAGDVLQAAGRSEELLLWGTPVRAARAVKKSVEAMRETEMAQNFPIPDSTAPRGGATAISAVRSRTFIIDQRMQEPGLRSQRSGSPGATAAGLVRSGDTVYVTLVLHPLLAPEEIRSAFVRECPPDSFQVLLPNGTTIGYRTPTGYLP